MTLQAPALGQPPPLVPLTSGPNDILQRAWRVTKKQPYLLALGLAVAMFVTNIGFRPNFNYVQQLATYSPLAVAAIANTPAIIGGGIDISVSPTMTLSALVFAGTLEPAGLGGWEAVPLLMLLGALVGAVNGIVITSLRLPPIVVTLCMMFVLTGVDLDLGPSPISVDHSWVSNLGSNNWVIPGPIVAIAVPLLIWGLLRVSAYGRSLYAVGGNAAVAYSSGINVNLVRILSYSFGSMIAALGGIVLVAVVNSADASTTSSYTLISLAAVALGGTAMTGGRGGAAGAVFGAAVIYLTQNLLTIFGIPTSALELAYGLILLVAVIIGAVLTPRPRGT